MTTTNNQEWYEVHYTDENGYDYKTDILADDADDAKRIFEITTNCKGLKVFGVYTK